MVVVAVAAVAAAGWAGEKMELRKLCPLASKPPSELLLPGALSVVVVPRCAEMAD